MVAGLRAFTAPTVLWIMRHGGPWAVVLSVLALLEYAGDLHPKAPSRTSAPGLIARIASGTFVGWSLAATAGASTVAGAIAGVAGALVGTYGGLALRLRTIARLGPIPAALLEDVVAISIAILSVGYVA
ncbi:MAG: hypothetical protein JOZ01_08535 [Candidatus Eremiobacteraeota bacterium]|nr:hypothetical protein [Candidatus Eremiobacteraeota bacterium]